MSMKNPLTPAGIEPATFRFVAQHLNHCATAVETFRGENKDQYNINCKSSVYLFVCSFVTPTAIGC